MSFPKLKTMCRGPVPAFGGIRKIDRHEVARPVAVREDRRVDRIVQRRRRESAQNRDRLRHRQNRRRRPPARSPGRWILRGVENPGIPDHVGVARARRTSASPAVIREYVCTLYVGTAARGCTEKLMSLTAAPRADRKSRRALRIERARRSGIEDRLERRARVERLRCSDPPAAAAPNRPPRWRRAAAGARRRCS